MRKRFLIVSAIALALALVLLMTGCGDPISQADSLVLNGIAKTTFVQNTETITDLSEILDFSVTATINGQKYVMNYSDYKNVITVEGFTLDTLTSTPRTATIRYQGLSVTFTYSVVPPESEQEASFAGGNGSVESPYRIATLEQFTLINNYCGTAGVMFELIDDIDCSAVDLSLGALITETFLGTLDGNGHTLTFSVPQGTGGYVFNKTVGTANRVFVKDLNVVFNGQVCFAFDTTSARLENVKISGSMEVSGNNYAPFLTYCRKGATLIDCVSDVTITGTSPWCAGFVAFSTIAYTDGSLFKNCEFSGSISGIATAAFCANPTPRYVGQTQFQDCKVSGEVRGLYAAKYYAPANNSQRATDALVESQGCVYTDDKTTANLSALATGTEVTGEIVAVGDTATASFNADGYVEFKMNDGGLSASKVVVVTSFSTKRAEDGASLLKIGREVIEEDVEGVFTSVSIKKAKAIGLTTAEIVANNYTPIVVRGEWVTCSVNGQDLYVYDNDTGNDFTLNAVSVVTFYAVALDADNKLIGCVKLDASK